MFQESSRSILCGDISLDPHLLNLELDKRLGISLLIPVRNNFLPQITQIKLLEPDQYFYPSTDLHITLQVIATGNSQFNPENHPIRYFPQTAHVTLMRFWRPLQNSEAFINILKEARNISFGCYQVNSVKLNICDWYNQREKRHELYRKF